MNFLSCSKLFFRSLSSIMTKTALIIGSDGSEDIELIVTSDVLRRAGLFLNFYNIGLTKKGVRYLVNEARDQCWTNFVFRFLFQMRNLFRLFHLYWQYGSERENTNFHIQFVRLPC